MPRQFWMPKDQAKMETAPGEAKSHSQKAQRKGEKKCMTPYDIQVKISRGLHRVRVPACRILSAKGGAAARRESFDLRVMAYIHEYPATESVHCMSTPEIVMSNMTWSASSNLSTLISGRIEGSMRHAFLKVVIHIRINVMLYRICRSNPNKE